MGSSIESPANSCDQTSIESYVCGPTHSLTLFPFSTAHTCWHFSDSHNSYNNQHFKNLWQPCDQICPEGVEQKISIGDDPAVSSGYFIALFIFLVTWWPSQDSDLADQIWSARSLKGQIMDKDRLIAPAVIKCDPSHQTGY
jgi:hypothetical protein